MCTSGGGFMEGIFKMMGSTARQALSTPPPAAAQPLPPQAQSAPQQARAAASAAGGQRSGGGSPTPTMMSGAGGVDPKLLNIGRGTLLGGS